MLVPVVDRAQVTAILADIETGFAGMELFRADRREIVQAYSRYAREICDAIVEAQPATGWLDASSPHLPRASQLLLALTRTFRAILPVMARVSAGRGAPTVRTANEAFEAAKSVAEVTRVLRHMVKRGGWGNAQYDAEARRMVLTPPDDEIQARDSHNSVRLRQSADETLRAGLRRPLSPDSEPADVHGSAIERLNGAYSKTTFKAVMRLLRVTALSQARAEGLCSILEIDRTTLEDAISTESGIPRVDVSAVLADLVFRFDSGQDGEQFLLELQPGKVTTIPLLVVERTLDESEYIRISKSRDPVTYSARQQELTKSLETRVGNALRTHAPDAEIRRLELPGALKGVVGGEIDRVASDPGVDAILLTQVKYLLDHDNTLVAKAVAQLQRDEALLFEQWPAVSAELKGWHGRDLPSHLAKVVVTNWFLGTHDIPSDVRVVSLNDLLALAPAGDVRRLIDQLAVLPEPQVVPAHTNTISLFGYSFVYHTAI